MRSQSAYALITPARNEATRIEITIASVAAQTHAPARWIVVDDGSTDGTAEIVERYLPHLPYLRLRRRRDRGFDAVGGGVVATFMDGLQALDVDTPYFGKLDADIQLEPDYYERLVRILDGRPTLGIASGQNYVRASGGRVAVERRLWFHPVGGARLYRSDAFKSIGGLVESPGWDTLDVVRARMREWDTRNFDDLRVMHLRPLGTRSALREGVRRRGRSAYLLAYSPVYMGLRVIWFALRHRPRPQHAWWLLGGYLDAALARETPIVTPEERRWFRRFQLRRLIGLAN
jgi:glycosyltransferase involved in cell wall biosynthesis